MPKTWGPTWRRKPFPAPARLIFAPFCELKSNLVFKRSNFARMLHSHQESRKNGKHTLLYMRFGEGNSLAVVFNFILCPEVLNLPNFMNPFELHESALQLPSDLLCKDIILHQLIICSDGHLHTLAAFKTTNFWSVVACFFTWTMHDLAHEYIANNSLVCSNARPWPGPRLWIVHKGDVNLQAFSVRLRTCRCHGVGNLSVLLIIQNHRKWKIFGLLS